MNLEYMKNFQKDYFNTFINLKASILENEKKIAETVSS